MSTVIVRIILEVEGRSREWNWKWRSNYKQQPAVVEKRKKTREENSREGKEQEKMRRWRGRRGKVEGTWREYVWKSKGRERCVDDSTRNQRKIIILGRLMNEMNTAHSCQGV